MTGMPAARSKDGWSIIAATALAVAGYGFYTGLPMLVGVIADVHRFTDQQIGWIGSSELAGMLIGAMTAPLLVARKRFLSGAFFCLALLGLTLVGSAMANGLDQSIAMRLVGGFGGGLAYSLAVSRVALTANPVRAFGIMNAASVFAAALQDFVTPGLIEAHGLAGGLLPPALMIVGSAVTVCGMRPGLAAPVAEECAQAGRTNRIVAAGWLFLFGVVVCQIAPGAFWTYIERLAGDVMVPAQTLGSTLTGGLLIGGFLCLWSPRMEALLGVQQALFIVIALLTLTMISSLVAGQTVFIVRYVAFAVLWNLLIVFQLSAATSLDPSGKLVGLVPAAQTIGTVIGPTAGGFLLLQGIGLGETLSFLSLPMLAGLILSIVLFSRRSGYSRKAERAPVPKVG